jgi:hypothetical protein
MGIIGVFIPCILFLVMNKLFKLTGKKLYAKSLGLISQVPITIAEGKGELVKLLKGHKEKDI